DFGERVVHRREDGRLEWPVPLPTLMAIGCRRLASFDEYAEARAICSRTRGGSPGHAGTR
ncbi:MAG: hypothetical protein R6X02_10035, partial [Enhygromyxa sp.]